MKLAWKLGLPDLKGLSLRRLYACIEAHEDYHRGPSSRGREMSEARLAELGIEGF